VSVPLGGGEDMREPAADWARRQPHPPTTAAPEARDGFGHYWRPLATPSQFHPHIFPSVSTLPARNWPDLGNINLEGGTAFRRAGAWVSNAAGRLRTADIHHAAIGPLSGPVIAVDVSSAAALQCLQFRACSE
jgi:hypothetical protein